MCQNLSAQSKQIFLVVDVEEAIARKSQALKEKYPQVQILTAQDAQSAESKVQIYYPDLVVMELSLADKPYSIPNPEVGIQLLKTLMLINSAPNIAVLSTYIKSLVRVKHQINSYKSGFAAMDKISTKEMLKAVDFALSGSNYLPPLVRSLPEFDPKWIEMLNLKFEQGFTDQAIAKRMGVTARTICNYWLKLQDAFGIYNEPEKDLKIQIGIAARKIGLIS